jgi:hypothetical protein
VTKKERNTYKRIGAYFRTMMGGGSPNEREQAREKLEALLKKLGKASSDMSDLLELERQAEIEEKEARAAAQGATYDAQTGATVKPAGIPCINFVYDQLTRYLDLKDHEFTAVTLWILHTWFYARFMHTPRLTFLSPVHDCGKSTAMSLLEKLAFRPEKSDDSTPAAIYWALEQGARTLLLDEMGNTNLLHNLVLRKIINSGHRRGGTIARLVGNRRKLFPLFAPMALAANSSHHPLPGEIFSRSIIINMQRSRKSLLQFDSNRTEDLNIVRDQIWLWARPDLELNPDPEMPAGLRRGRPRDNWRPLFSIADTFGSIWGQRARDAALAFAAARRDDDIKVQLLEDIREIFVTLGVDRFLIDALVEQLRALPDAGWDELPLTRGLLAKMLKSFGIEKKTVWPKGGRGQRGKSGKGYFREQFEAVWASYCEDEAAPAQKDSKIRYLRSG